MGGPSGPQPRDRVWVGTHPKCCTTLGSMAASCSMEGNWYLQAEGEVRAGGSLGHRAGEIWTGGLPGTYPWGNCDAPTC